MILTCRCGLRLALIAILCLGALSGCGGARARYASHLQRGQEYLASGNLDKASVEFRNAVQIEPKGAPGLYLIGRVAESRNNVREAYGYYQAALDADPKYEPARAGAGKMLVFSGAAKQALDLVAPALATHLDNADLLAVRAAAHQLLKERDAARADAERAVQLAPANEDALTVLAALYSADKDYPRAISLVSTAIGKAPASVGLREVLTNLYLQSGQPDKAQEQMRKLIELRPLELPPRSQLALHLAREHDLDGAQRVLEEAVQALAAAQQDAKADAARLMLVDFVSAQRSPQQGEKILRDFIARQPDNFELRLALGALLQRSGAVDAALTEYEQVLKRDGTGPKGMQARDRIAAIRFARGQYPVARQLIAQVLQKNPRDDEALILRANMEMQAKDPASAIADLRAVLRSQPGSVALQRMLAAAHLANKESALAEEALRAGMQAAPNDVPVRIELAQLLATTDRKAQGLTVLQDTVKRLPDNPQAREALIKAYLASGDVPAASAAAQEMQTRQPQSIVGFYYAGLIAAQQKHWEESQNNFESALKLQPQRTDLLGLLAQVMIERGQYDAAVAKVRTALAQQPTNAELPNLLGDLYFSRKDFAHASEAFSSAIALAPGQWQSHSGLARVKLASNDPDGAMSEYQAALKLAPAEPQLVTDAAVVFEKQGKIDAAIEGYEALYKLNPQVQQLAANNLAMLLVTYRKDRASLDRARDLTAQFTTSDNSSLLDTVGWVRFKRGEYQEALPSLEQAAKRAPDSKVIRFHLAMAELQLGQKDRARSDLELALDGANNFQGADEARVALASLKVRA